MLHESGPEGVCLPNLPHFFNWNALCFGQEEVDEECHDQHEEGKEEEQAELHVAKHCQEDLCNQESEKHVHRHIDTLSSRTNLQGKDLTRHQPT